MNYLELINLAISSGVLIYVVRVEHRLTKMETLMAEHIKADAVTDERIARSLDRLERYNFDRG